MRIFCKSLYIALALIATLSQITFSQNRIEPFYLFQSSDIIDMPPYTPAKRTMATDKKEGPLHFAHPFLTNIDINNDGRWIELSDGTKIWTLAIRSEGAKSINLIIDKFKVGENDKLLLYSPYYDNPILEFGAKNITPTGVLPTVPIPGDIVIVEYQQHPAGNTTPEIEIGSVNHDYLGVIDMLSNNKVGKFGDAGKCNNDVTCADEDIIKDNYKSACRIMIDGTELCSGTLINNTANDGTPYFLSAAHCFKREESPFTTIFFFNYEIPSCQKQVEGNKLQYITGGNMRAIIDTFDIALMEMYETPPPSYMPYWAGWSLDEEPLPPFYAIHHPMGDVKKYSITEDKIIGTTFTSYTVTGQPFAKDCHWQVKKWTTGTTEGGSSGCALLDASGLLIGTLSGGEATCSRPENDYFVRFNKAWKSSKYKEKQLAIWLDPHNLKTQKIAGTQFYETETKRISPITKTDNAGAYRYTTKNDGYIAGHNSFKHTAFAQLFENENSASISGIYLISGTQNINSTKNFEINIWSDNNGVPGDKLVSIENIKVSSLVKNGETFYEFEKPVEVSGSFHAGFAISYHAESLDSIAAYIKKGTAGTSKNLMTIYDGAKWHAYSELVEPGRPASLWIDVLASGVEIPNNDTPVKHTELHIFPQKVKNGFSLAIDDNTMQHAEIFDYSGRMVIKQQINSTEGYINCHQLQSGIYIVRVKLNNGYAERKIVKLSN